MSVREQYLEALGIELWKPRPRPAAAAPAVAACAVAQFAVTAPDQPAAPLDPPANARGESLATSAPLPVAPTCGIGMADEAAWEALRVQVSGCTRCELCKTRTQTVFGVGNRRAELLVIGEAPGADEDLQGEPFVGRAGQLLNSMLRAMGNPRETVYIANVLKCRPPGNRDPKPVEVASCLPYLQQQVDMIQPQLLLAVGRIAAQNLLATDTPIGRLRGHVHRFGARATPLIVTYHPAYLLRSPSEKRRSWGDLKFVRAELTRLRAAAAGSVAPGA
jgi:uracil-DNA glycosylase family 4